MSFFPLVKKVASYQFKYVISHFIICHKQAPKFYCSKEPIPETQKINTSTSVPNREKIITNSWRTPEGILTKLTINYLNLKWYDQLHFSTLKKT